MREKSESKSQQFKFIFLSKRAFNAVKKFYRSKPHSNYTLHGGSKKRIVLLTDTCTLKIPDTVYATFL